MSHPVRSQRGGALLVVMVLLGIGALLSAALLRVTSYSHRRSHDVLAKRQADYSAMAGVEAAMADIRANPERFLRKGATWAPLEGSPPELGFRVALTEKDGVYLLSSTGGSPPHQVVYTLKLKRSSQFTEFALGLGRGGGTRLELKSDKEIAVNGAPVYVEGDLVVQGNEKKGYRIYEDGEGYPVIVTGKAYFQHGSREYDLTAEDLNASELVVGAPPLGMDQFLAEAVAYLTEYLRDHPHGPVRIYDPDDWETYKIPSSRVVVWDGDLGCAANNDKDAWGDAADEAAKFYGTLIVNGEVCQPSSMKSLEVHGTLLAAGIDLNTKQQALILHYDPTYIPPILKQIPGSGSSRIVLIDTDVKH